MKASKPSSAASSRRTKNILVTLIFATLHSVLGILPGPWRQWSIPFEPLEGMILGPKLGFIAALVGSSVRTALTGPIIVFSMIAEPIGVATAGLLVKGKWQPVAALYGIMLAAYFIHPYGRILPLWTILDILLAFVLIYPAAKFGKNVLINRENAKKLTVAVVFIAFVSTVTDSLTRVFLLVPVGLYQTFFPKFETLYYVFVTYAAISYVEDVIITIISLIISIPVLLVLEKGKIIHWPLS